MTMADKQWETVLSLGEILDSDPPYFSFQVIKL